MIDLTTGRPLTHHKRGEICARGPHIMKGYLKNDNATRDIIDPEGWLHTGRHITRDTSHPYVPHPYACMHARMHARTHAPVTSVCAKTHNHTTHAQTYGQTRDITILTHSSIIEVDHHTEPSDSLCYNL